MFASNFSLYGGDLVSGAYVPHTFALIRQDNVGTTRIRTDQPLGAGTTMSIKHSISGKAGAQIDRHLVQITEDFVIGLGTIAPTVNLTFSIPRTNGAMSTAHVEGLYKNLLSAVGISESTAILPAGASSFLAALLRGES